MYVALPSQRLMTPRGEYSSFVLSSASSYPTLMCGNHSSVQVGSARWPDDWEQGSDEDRDNFYVGVIVDNGREVRRTGYSKSGSWDEELSMCVTLPSDENNLSTWALTLKQHWKHDVCDQYTGQAIQRKQRLHGSYH